MPELVVTGDGSHSLRMDDQSETYHSRHGAITESKHVFIKYGFDHINSNDQIRILEVGFGTGLNCLLTVMAAGESGKAVKYTALEPFPPSIELIEKLNYTELLGKDTKYIFTQIHEAPFGSVTGINGRFTLEKLQVPLSEFATVELFDLVYFDAFAPAINPELWTAEVFSKLHSIMSPSAFLVTYCAKGEVKRAMRAAGFSVEALQGPPGKREMTRAFKS